MEQKTLDPLFLTIDHYFELEPPFNFDFGEEKKKIERAFEYAQASLLDAIYSLKKDKQFKRYINHCQFLVIKKSDHITDNVFCENLKEFLNIPNANLLIDLYSCIYKNLQDLIGYFEIHHPEFFNLDSPIAEGKKTATRFEFSNILKSMGKNMDCPIQATALAPIREFMSSGSKCTYRRFYYLTGLSKEIVKHCSVCSKISNECNLRDALIANNFNSNAFYTSQVEGFENDCQQKQLTNKKLEVLAYHHKRIKQVLINDSISYDYQGRDIKGQLILWLEEEMAYVKNKKEEAPSCDNKTMPSTERYKISTDLSVHLVSYISGLMFKTGVYNNNKMNDAAGFIARHLKTKNSENLSESSFVKKLYNPSLNTLEATKAIIIEMLNICTSDLERKG